MDECVWVYCPEQHGWPHNGPARLLELPPGTHGKVPGCNEHPGQQLIVTWVWPPGEK